MSLVLHIVKKHSSPCFQLTGFACLFGFLFPSLCQKVSVESTKFCCFFHTHFKSSSLLVTSRTSLSDRERSIKQPNTTITKLYSNNTSWVARSRCVLESVLDVFMLAWVMSSIAATERSQSVAVLFFSPSRCCITPSPCCLFKFPYIFHPGEKLVSK